MSACAHHIRWSLLHGCNSLAGTTASNAKTSQVHVTVSNQALPKTQLFQGKKLETNDDTPKAQVFEAFRSKKHDPFQRNSRHGYFIVNCKNCPAACAVSCNQRDGWYVTTCHDAVLRQCSSGAGTWYVWWCTVVYVVVWCCMVWYAGEHGGACWCMGGVWWSGIMYGGYGRCMVMYVVVCCW